MAEPLSIAALVASLATLFVNLFQSIKMGHLKSSCFGGCCEFESDVAMKDSTTPLKA